MMKARKEVKLILILLVIITVFSGCSGKDDAADMTGIDISSLGSELLEKAEFEDELNLVDDAMVKKLYHIEEFTEAQVYIGSGATAEEIAIFEFDSGKAAAEGLKAAEDRLEEQKENFASYVPKELQKLDNAVVKQAGNYLVVCVSNGDEAEKIIKSYIK